MRVLVLLGVCQPSPLMKLENVFYHLQGSDWPKAKVPFVHMCAGGDDGGPPGGGGGGGGGGMVCMSASKAAMYASVRPCRLGDASTGACVAPFKMEDPTCPVSTCMPIKC